MHSIFNLIILTFLSSVSYGANYNNIEPGKLNAAAAYTWAAEIRNKKLGQIIDLSDMTKSTGNQVHSEQHGVSHDDLIFPELDKLKDDTVFDGIDEFVKQFQKKWHISPQVPVAKRTMIGNSPEWQSISKLAHKLDKQKNGQLKPLTNLLSTPEQSLVEVSNSVPMPVAASEQTALHATSAVLDEVKLHDGDEVLEQGQSNNEQVDSENDDIGLIREFERKWNVDPARRIHAENYKMQLKVNGIHDDGWNRIVNEVRKKSIKNKTMRKSVKALENEMGDTALKNEQQVALTPKVEKHKQVYESISDHEHNDMGIKETSANKQNALSEISMVACKEKNLGNHRLQDEHVFEKEVKLINSNEMEPIPYKETSQDISMITKEKESNTENELKIPVTNEKDVSNVKESDQELGINSESVFQNKRKFTRHILNHAKALGQASDVINKNIPILYKEGTLANSNLNNDKYINFRSNINKDAKRDAKASVSESKLVGVTSLVEAGINNVRNPDMELKVPSDLINKNELISNKEHNIFKTSLSNTKTTEPESALIDETESNLYKEKSPVYCNLNSNQDSDLEPTISIKKEAVSSKDSMLNAKGLNDGNEQELDLNNDNEIETLPYLETDINDESEAISIKDKKNVGHDISNTEDDGQKPTLHKEKTLVNSDFENLSSVKASDQDQTSTANNEKEPELKLDDDSEEKETSSYNRKMLTSQALSNFKDSGPNSKDKNMARHVLNNIKESGENMLNYGLYNFKDPDVDSDVINDQQKLYRKGNFGLNNAKNSDSESVAFEGKTQGNYGLDNSDEKALSKKHSALNLVVKHCGSPNFQKTELETDTRTNLLRHGLSNEETDLLEDESPSLGQQRDGLKFDVNNKRDGSINCENYFKFKTSDLDEDCKQSELDADMTDVKQSNENNYCKFLRLDNNKDRKLFANSRYTNSKSDINKAIRLNMVEIPGPVPYKEKQSLSKNGIDNSNDREPDEDDKLYASKANENLEELSDDIKLASKVRNGIKNTADEKELSPSPSNEMPLTEIENPGISDDLVKANNFLQLNARPPARYVIKTDSGCISSLQDDKLKYAPNFSIENSRTKRAYRYKDEDVNSDKRENYIKQLEDSFPRDNDDDYFEQVMKELKEHVRVKRS